MHGEDIGQPTTLVFFFLTISHFSLLITGDLLGGKTGFSRLDMCVCMWSRGLTIDFGKL